MHLKVQDTDLLKISIEDGLIKSTHFHSAIELIMVLEGSLDVMVENERTRLSQEDCLVINSNYKHSIETEQYACFLRLAFSYERVTNLLSHSVIELSCNSVKEAGLKYEELRQLLRRLMNVHYQEEEKKTLQYHNLSYQIITLLADKFMTYIGDDRGEIDSEEARYVEIINYINDQYRNDISLQDLADKLHLSISYLSRYIKEVLGCNFVQYLNRVRLEHAVNDLLRTDLVITRIAYDNGFPNITAFNKKFKDAYGMTPSAYRRQKEQEQDTIKQREDVSRLLEKVEGYLQQHPQDEPVSEESRHVPVRIFVNQIGQLDKNWCQVINIGAAEDLLLSSVQEHMKLLKKELGYTHVRFWNVFGKDMHVTDKDKEGYNFSYIYRVLDFLTANGLKPYMDFGFKPKQIVKNIRECEKNEESDIMVDDLDKFRDLMNTFLRHVVRRYGEEEVSGWYFEQWGDRRFFVEDLGFTYYDVFDVVYDAVKRYAPQAQVGGSGVSINDSQCRRLQRLLDGWTEEHHRPDFISVYMYPYMRTGKGDTKYIRQSTDTAYIASQLTLAREYINDMGFGDAKLHLTEWNMTLSNRNYLNDSCYKAAYLAKALTDIRGLTETSIYFVGTDLFSESFDTARVLYGGSGLISKDGIFKPSFYAFKYMNRLGSSLLYSNDHCIVTADEKRGFRIVCFNPGTLNYQYYMKKEEEIDGQHLEAYFEEEQKSVLHLLLDGVENGRYKIKTRRLNRENGSAFDEWRHMEMDLNLDTEDITYLRNISVPRCGLQYTSTASQLLNIRVELEPQELQYIHVEYMP